MGSRYWAYLFENLERSISGLYDTCEKQDSIIQCKEVLIILDNYTRDFTNLIEWLNLKYTYEQTPQPLRPNALAWEIRKPSFSALPHTRAYEKLVGLNTSTSCPVRSLPKSNRTGAVASIPKPPTPSSLQERIVPTESTPIITIPLTVEIGLQTELEEDPDIYYFAGGRHVASQTDYDNEEYGPLDFFGAESNPVIIVLPSSEHQLETVATSSTNNLESDPSTVLLNASSPPLTTVEVVSLVADTISPTPSVETKSSSTQLSVGVLSESMSSSEHSQTQQLESKIITLALTQKLTQAQQSEPKVTSLDAAKFGPPGPQSTNISAQSGPKSEVTTTSTEKSQLEQPKFEPEASTVSETAKSDGKSAGILRTIKSAPAEKTSTASTFADKARNGMLKAGQGSTVHRSGILGSTFMRPTLSSSAAASNRGKVSDQPRINYRSNIASRFRTAANTGQPPPVVNQVLSPKHSASVHVPISTCTASPPPKVLSSHKTTNYGSGTPRVPGQKLKQLTAVSLSMATTTDPTNSDVMPTSPGTKQVVKCPAPVHPGVLRSKSMVNPVGFSGRNIGKIDIKIPPILQAKSFVSLPDETARSNTRRRSGTVDEDGWETVRNRSNRSKYSPSNSSLHSSCATLSRTSLDKTGSVDSPASPSSKEPPKPKLAKSGPPGGATKKSKACPTQTYVKPSLTSSKKPPPLPESDQVALEVKIQETKEPDGGGDDEAEIECRVDEEEIKLKEAALDIAIREEELLEEELLQVEKDFEEIENQSNGDSMTVSSENENLVSSPEVQEVEMTELELCVVENRGGLSNLETNKFFYLEKETRSAEDFLPREPGRIVTLRDKLMSPARKYDSAETLRRHQAKLANAERNRERLLQSKYNHYVELSDRFESLNESTKRLVEERTELILQAEARRKRAAEKRQLYLKGIKRKAHDEDSKAREIAFINLLEAQNKRHDFLASAQEVEDRLQLRENERKLKLEERGMKAKTVLERQFRIRNNWESKLENIQEKRRRNEERIAREKEERAKERMDLAQGKARGHEERISALNAAKQAEKEELQKKIQQRQEDTARRHDENIEHIRKKAMELSAPRSSDESTIQTSVRMCTLCQVTIQSEVQELAHLRGRAHLDAIKRTEKDSNSNSSVTSQGGVENFGIKFITDVQLDKLKPGVSTDKNRGKTMRKHCKKLLQKLETSGLEFEAVEKTKPEKSVQVESKLSRLVQKNLREIGRLTGLFNAAKGSAQLASSLDHILRETRKITANNKFIQDSLIRFGAFAIAQRLLECKATDLPTKVIVNACNFIVSCVLQNFQNTVYVLRSSCICSILELTASRWNALVPDDNRWLCGSPLGANEPLPVDSAVVTVTELLLNILNIVPDPYAGTRKLLPEAEVKIVEARAMDIAGYLVASGALDRLSVYCSGIRGPVDHQPLVADLLRTSIDLITMFVYCLEICWDRSKSETSQLLAALESSEFAGTISMSYSLLLHQGAPIRPRQGPDQRTCAADINCNSTQASPPPPSIVTGSIVKTAISLINAVAKLDINIVQNVLGSEAISLQFRHIVSQLLWQVVPHRTEDIVWSRLLNEVLMAIGNFTVLNKQNQAIIQSGQTPTILQQLCCVPDAFFLETNLTRGYFPCLIACTSGCEKNLTVLIQEDIDPELLTGFLKSEYSKVNAITKRILETNTSATTNGNSNGNSLPSSKKAKKSQTKV